jgi:hypothetical protein
MEFKPATNRISRIEREFLLGLNLKWCSCCKQAVDLKNFYILKNGKTTFTCKKCVSQKGSIWKKENKEKVNETKRICRERNKEKYTLTDRAWRERTRERRREVYNAYREENKERINEKKREVYARNSQHYKEYKRAYRKSQKENPLYQLTKRIRDRTYQVFRNRKIPKTKSTKEMLGCSWEELKEHIERQFVDGMSWERMKEIHIDHIIPLASAKTEEELIKLAHYKNLQPLWARDNISKGAKF